MQKLKFLNFYKWERIIGPILGLILIWLSTYTSPMVGLFLSVPMFYHIYCGWLLYIKSDDFVKNRLTSDIVGVVFGLLYSGYGILSTTVLLIALQQIEPIRFTHVVLCAIPAFIGLLGVISVVYNIYCIFYFHKNKKDVVNALRLAH